MTMVLYSRKFNFEPILVMDSYLVHHETLLQNVIPLQHYCKMRQLFYYKMLQKLITKMHPFFITKCESFIAKFKLLTITICVSTSLRHKKIHKEY